MRKHRFCQEHNNPTLFLSPGHLEAAAAPEMPPLEAANSKLPDTKKTKVHLL